MKNIFFLLSLITLSFAANAQTSIYSNTSPITILDNSVAATYSSDIVVSGFVGTITDVGVVIRNFTHAAPSEVAICLEAPSGQKIILQDQIWGTPASDISYMISDLGSSQVGPFALATNSSIKPTANSGLVSFNAPGPGFTYSNPGPANAGTATMASTFGGATANGAWKLWVIDVTSGDAGTINGGWELHINPNRGLPIYLSNFKIDCETTDMITVSWTPLDEGDIKEFTIQTSAEGTSFEDLEKIEVVNFQTGQTLSTTIRMPYEKTYVRLKLKDVTNEIAYSEIRAVSCRSQSLVEVLTVSPNPITEDYIVIDNPTGEFMQYEMTDLNGRVILKGSLEAQRYKLNIKRNIPSGLYLLRLKSDKEQYSFKLNKQ